MAARSRLQVRESHAAGSQLSCANQCQNEGSCDGKVCNCKEGFFGVWCQNKIYGFSSGDTFTQDVTLLPFQSFYFTENYDVGEPGTSIDIKARSKPFMMMVLNQRKEINNSFFTEEKNEKTSQTSLLTTWVNDVERKSFDQEEDNLFVQVTNMAPFSVQMTITISRNLSVTQVLGAQLLPL